MTIDSVSVLCGGEGPILPTPPLDTREPAYFPKLYDNRKNKLPPSEVYEVLLKESDAEILIYMHDDIEILDRTWLDAVHTLFNSPNTVAVGLGGATSLGRPDLYRKPYDIWNLARGGYASNQVDAEVHGERFTGVRRVAVLDAFFMAVRTSFLQSVGGWPVVPLTHHCLDLWLACEAARAGKEIWMTGIKCNHYGGRSSTKPGYAKADWLQGGTMEQDHIQPHRWIYYSYRDVLPIEVKNA